MCFELPIAPKEIYQCSQGHFLCNVCLKKIDKKCPTCRENWTNLPNLPARNRMAENLLQKMTVNSKSEPIESKRKNESGAMNNISQKKAKSSNSTADSPDTTSISVSDSQNTYTFTELQPENESEYQSSDDSGSRSDNESGSQSDWESRWQYSDESEPRRRGRSRR